MRARTREGGIKSTKRSKRSDPMRTCEFGEREREEAAAATPGGAKLTKLTVPRGFAGGAGLRGLPVRRRGVAGRRNWAGAVRSTPVLLIKRTGEICPKGRCRKVLSPERRGAIAEAIGSQRAESERTGRPAVARPQAALTDRTDVTGFTPVTASLRWLRSGRRMRDQQALLRRQSRRAAREHRRRASAPGEARGRSGAGAREAVVNQSKVNDANVWGLHMGAHHGVAPIADGYVAIGWPELGDPTQLKPDREAFKSKYAQVMPNAKPGAVRVAAGQVFRFYHEMRIGDLIVFPSKFDRQINIGSIVGNAEFNPMLSSEYPSRRRVEWLKHFDRAKFSQSALYEIGSALTLFRISSHADEILAALSGEGPDTLIVTEDEEEATAAIVEQFQETTEDFIIKRLKNDQTPYEFEHLLTCMGYHARVTKSSSDGGIDVIAHRDELGFEPPIIKVQCKQSTGGFGRPEVQKLYGSIERDERALFVTLGSYSAEARTFELTKSNLRLLDGKDIVDLIQRHYAKFSPRYRALIPLKQTFSPA